MIDYEDWICEQDEDADTSYQAYLDFVTDAAYSYFGSRNGK